MSDVDKKTIKIISSIILVQGAILFYWVLNSSNFFDFMGFSAINHINIWAWIISLFVVVSYVWGAASIGLVRENMFCFNRLKFLALVGALVSGVFEEILFRKLLMDYLQGEDIGNLMQIFLSGLAFSIAHIVWGGKALSAAVNATFYTFFLGSGLAVIYIVSDRNLALCIIAHTAVTSLIEPGLIKSAVLDKLGYLKERSS